MNDYNSTYYESPQFVLPNATAVLILGIMSIVGCCCYGVVGLVLGVIAIVLSSKDLRLYKSDPTRYTLGSYNNLNAGRICAIIGVIFSIICIIILIFYFIVGTVVGWENMQDKESLEQAFKNL